MKYLKEGRIISMLLDIKGYNLLNRKLKNKRLSRLAPVAIL